MAQVEAVLLTGGASRRMGADKASLDFGGEPLAERIARALAEVACRITVLGREPIADFEFQKDNQEFAGPLTALSEFKPGFPFVMVCSCDLPRFDPKIVECFLEDINDKDAAVPISEGMLQPLCALYRKKAFANIGSVLQGGKQSMMAWLETLDLAEIPALRLADTGIDPRSIQGFNSPEELTRLIS